YKIMNTKIPKRRFKGFTDDWEQRELGEIANIIPGGTPKTTVKDYWWPKEIPWMSSGEVNKRIVEKTDDMISKNGFENSSAKLIKEKSVLIALAGQGKTRGLVAVNEVPLTTNQSIAAFELEANITNYKFLFYTLDRQYMRLRHISSGDGTRGGLNKNLLESYKSHFPVLEEQNHISEFISKIENLITLHNKRLNTIECIIDAYRHRLLEGHLKLLGSSKTSKIKLTELMEVRDERFTLDSGYELMSFVAYNGVTPKNDRYNREFLVKNDKKKYKLTKLNDLIYSSNNLDIGSININKTKDALISDVYEVFK